jgi:hypothetical protein
VKPTPKAVIVASGEGWVMVYSLVNVETGYYPNTTLMDRLIWPITVHCDIPW